ncbi:hypothetical protein AB0M46_07335 [Dactylosporangium sp. NPDC051485]|uniref:hypothetical protein n=1 Tax=Dactylosporangium sp. NPDC051485 TaxID=3154846 RepID=UPI003413A53C
MNELDELARVRAGVAPMSAHARNAARLRLADAMAGEGPRILHRPVERRRLAIGLAFGVTLTATAAGALVLPRPGTDRPSGAAGSESGSEQVPRPDQYVFTETRNSSPTPGPDYHVWSWMAADGTRPGRVRSVKESPSCRPASSGSPAAPSGAAAGASTKAGWSRDGCSWEDELPVYDPKAGLASAPYTVLAQLPTDPSLLAALQADPSIRVSTSKAPGAGGPVVTREAALWEVLRSLAGRLPAAQRVALFRALSAMRGVSIHSGIADAIGRKGVGFGVDDERLGRVVLIFDQNGLRYLGEAILDHDGRTQYSGTLLRTVVVDRIGQLPS